MTFQMTKKFFLCRKMSVFCDELSVKSMVEKILSIWYTSKVKFVRETNTRRDRCYMIKKIEILGMAIDNYTVREAMLQVEVYLNNSVMNTIENISMEMLVKAQNDEVLKESIEHLDLSVIGEKEILKAAGVSSMQRIRETVENEFAAEFMKRLTRNNKTVYLLGNTEIQIEKLEEFLMQEYPKLKISGRYALENCTGDFDKVINEVNIAEPDVIFSVLPTPQQEYFLKDNIGKFNVKIWYGLGQNYARKQGVSRVTGFAKKLIHRGMLHSMLSRYNKDE